MTKIIMDDLRTAGVGTCQQAKKWFERHGFDWRELHPSRGVDVERVLDIEEDTAYLDRVIKAAEERESRGQ